MMNIKLRFVELMTACPSRQCENYRHRDGRGETSYPVDLSKR